MTWVYLVVTVALLALCNALTVVCVLVAARRYIERKQAQAESTLRGWIAAQGENQDKPSKLAEMLAAAGEVIGAAAARSILATVNADKSHVARVANGVVDELQGQQNPLMGLLAGGKRGRGAAIQRLGQMLLPMLGGNNQGAGGNDQGSIRGRIRNQ